MHYHQAIHLFGTIISGIVLFFVSWTLIAFINAPIDTMFAGLFVLPVLCILLTSGISFIWLANTFLLQYILHRKNVHLSPGKLIVTIIVICMPLAMMFIIAIS